MNTRYNFPLLLTFVRLFGSPLIMPCLIFLLLPINHVLINSFVAVAFIFLSVTDLLDGFYARRYNQVTSLGAFLDPIADKSLLLSTLISLVAINKLFFYWAILFIGREFFIISLRAAAAQEGFSVPVSWYGKSKTCAQAFYIAFVIFNPWQRLPGHGEFVFIEYSMLCGALMLSMGSASHYYHIFANQMRMRAKG